MPHGRSPRHVHKRRRPEPQTALGPVRLQKLLAQAGFGSRRACEELVAAGRVEVNGRRAKLGDSADPGVDVVTLDGERIKSEKPSYWLLHKPTGVVTSVSDPHGRRTVMQIVPGHVGRVYPVGRLDRDSAGLVLLTNDGPLTQRLLHPSHESEKEYRVSVKGEIDERALERLRRGVHLEDGKTAPAKVSLLAYDPASDQSTLKMVLTEGRKRQIRRMLLAVGHPVKRLTRTRMGPLTLGRLRPGEARPLRADEVRALHAYAAKRGSRRGALKPSRR